MQLTARDLYCRTTESLVLNERTKFYPTKIPVPHHQLRHFISTAEQTFLYYAHKHDIYAIDLPSSQRSLVATLPFEARCLAVDHGWICVGGEVNGDCAFLKIERHETPTLRAKGKGKMAPPKCFGHELTIKELGGEIVNAMKIQKLSSDGREDSELVVLISNNDKSVKIYSLDRQEVLVTLKHSVPVNYASLSPDSRTIVAVGDANHVYFYRRVVKEAKGSPTTHQEYDWLLVGTPAVPIYDSMSDDFSFSVAFSPDGRLCAVSSQGGTISVFDMSRVNELADTESLERAVICAFKSSRAPLFGCVRSMAFSPEPWGLLAWAEDHGRVGIADVRQFFVRRQIMKLDPFASEITKVEIEDMTPFKLKGAGVKDKLKAQHLQRLQDEISSRSSVDEMVANAWAEESRSRQSRRDLLTYHHGLELDSRDRTVLHALETTMDHVQQTMTPPAEEDGRSHSGRDVQSNSNRISSGRPGSSGSEESGPTQRTPESEPEQRSAREGRGDTFRSGRTYFPRRRSSVILSSSSATLAPPQEALRSRFTASPSRMARPEDNLDDSELPPLMSTNDLTPSRHPSSYQPLPYNIPSSEPVVIQESSLPRTPPSGRTVSSFSPSRYSRPERIGSDRRYEGDPEFEADLEAHLSALSNRYGAAAEPISLAEVSTLPTTTIRSVVRRQEDARRRQMAYIETQVRRSENHVAIASSEIEALGNAIVNGVNAERHARIARNQEAQARYRAAVITNNASAIAIERLNPPTSEILRDLETLQSGAGPSTQPRTGTPPRRTSELRAISENDMRLARLMILSGARSAMDRNGNWVASAREVQAQQQATRPTGGAVNSLIEEAVREMGPGTAGVGWSPDGHFLYAGTEEGIFEYAINLRDRMQFPTCEMR